jgi:hypothetical protein
MPLPIPLHCLQGANVRAGTGFLVKDRTNVWLVTCVHAITGLKDTPASETLFLGASIQVVGTLTTLQLFEKGAQRFSVVTNLLDGFLVDVLAIKLTAPEADTLLPYEAYNLSTIIAPTHNEPVTAAGFPGMAHDLIEPTTLAGRIAEIVGISVKLTVPSAPGYSGSALLGENGLIGVVHGDVGEAPNFVSALAVTFEAIGPKLFV